MKAIATLGLAFLCIFGSKLALADDKEYRVPGAVVISTAQRHGYTFSEPERDGLAGGHRIARGAIEHFRRKKVAGTYYYCQFRGAHWDVPPNTTCAIEAFTPGTPAQQQRCAELRDGWKVKSLRFRGTRYRWVTRPIMIEALTLLGPEGRFNTFENAFSHCSGR